MKNIYKVLGLMSGTSLDGLDVAFATFAFTEGRWTYTLERTEVLKYSRSWLKRLANAASCTAEEWIQLDVEYGALLGRVSRDFLGKHNLMADFISSHGHTVFHQPEKGFTAQLGNGNAIHAQSGLPVVNDFRSLDVLRGGEGAPLVPAGDRLLFHEYDVCLNLGGIANLSREVKNERKAFDICFCNMGLNYLMQGQGKTFDKNGALASSGTVHQGMLKQLEKVHRNLRKKRPSLGREFFDRNIRPILDQKKISIADKLSTCVEATASEIAFALKENGIASVLCTGGGAFNAFLMTRLLDHGGDDINLIIPDEELVKFKEALVFAFLGVLRVENQMNCLRSVTHATTDSSSGVMTGFIL
jgi:anhydro-N-acetylmuramic acid kinase